MLPDLPKISGEELKHIPSFPGYAASKSGRIYSCLETSGKFGYWYVRVPRADKDGRKDIRLRRSGTYFIFKVAALVLETFVGPRPEGYQCCHNNGNCSDDRLDNLRWDTVQANVDDRAKHGMTLLGEKHGSTKLTEDQVRDIFRRRLRGENITSLTKEFRITRANINSIMRGSTWSHLNLHG